MDTVNSVQLLPDTHCVPEAIMIEQLPPSTETVVELCLLISQDFYLFVVWNACRRSKRKAIRVGSAVCCLNIATS